MSRSKEGKLVYYAYGGGPKKVTISRFKQSSACAGPAAKIHERNPHFDDEIEPKATIHRRFAQSAYCPRQYLNSYKSVGKFNIKDDEKDLISPSMMQVARRKEKAHMRLRSMDEGVEAKSAIEFDQAKNKPRLTISTKELNDYCLYVTKNEYDYRASKTGMKQAATPKPRVFCNSGNVPDWFKLHDRPENKVLPETSPTFNGTLTYLSRAQGWITVTPQNKNRTKPLERAGLGDNFRRPSPMMPEWMQIRASRPAKNPLVEAHLHPHKQTPVRSVFNFMHGSHNVTSKELADQVIAKMNTKETYRIYQWDENVGKQRYDSKPIAPKIGSLY